MGKVIVGGQFDLNIFNFIPEVANNLLILNGALIDCEKKHKKFINT